MRQSLLVHPSVFINQTVSLINPHFPHSGAQLNHPDHSAKLDAALTSICRSEPISEA